MSRSGEFLVIALVFSLANGAFAAGEGEIGGWRWAGDLRYRHENVYSEGTTSPTPSAYDQHRIMFRLGSKVAMSPSADTEFRLSTGQGRTSTNQTIGDGFANLFILLDRAYFTWRPFSSSGSASAGPNVSFFGGRVKNFFFSPKGSDLVWDSDLNFDGLSATYAMDSDLKPFVTGSFFWQKKNTTAENKDNHLVALQTGLTTKIASASLAAGIAIYHHTNMTAQTAIDATNFKGNTSTGSGATATYASHFTTINPGVEVGFSAGGFPLTLTGDLALNPAATASNLGFLVGLTMGESKNPGDWRLSYDYRQLGADCTVAAYTDGDSFSGGTDARGHRLRFIYRVSAPLQVGATVFLGAKNISAGATASSRNKAHLDLTWSF